MKTRVLKRSGLTVTELGFGGANIGNLFSEVTDQQSYDAVTGSWDRSIHYFDTAPHYGCGLSERRLGLATASKLDHPDLVISTKVGRLLKPRAVNEPADDMGFVQEAPFKRHFDFSYDGVMRSYEDSVQRLGHSRIDMLFMHDIGAYAQGKNHADVFKQAMDSGQKAMVELRDQGLVKAIGLGVNEWEVCQQTLACADFDTFMVANAFTLLNNDITRHFVGECEKRGLSIIAAAPFNSGILATGSEGRGHYFYEKTPPEILKKVQKLEAICREYQVELPAAAIQYPLQYDVVASVVTGISQLDRLDQTLQWYQATIPEEFWSALKEEGAIV